MNASGFSPGHRIGPHGAVSSEGPTLDAGLPVELHEVSGEWTRVRCSNGWEAWVPTHSVAPLSVAKSRWPLWALVAAAAIGIGYLATRSDSADPSASRPAAVALAVPTGWTRSADGLSAAESPADLTSAVPSGPRVLGQRISDGAPDLGALIATAQAGSPQLIGEPRAVTSPTGRPATVTELVETVQGVKLHRLYLVVKESDTAATAYLLEAPVPVWDAGAGTKLRLVAGI